MKHKILISTIAVLVACPAFADITTDNANPMCDSSTIGTTSGDTALDAVWNIVNQTCNPGQYFDMTTATCVTCTANSYCPGGTYNVESQTNGLNSCPNGYGLSAQGAGAQTDCYRTCTTADVAHSAGVTGGYYYGDNNRCNATECVTGYSLKNGINLYSNFTSVNQTSASWLSINGEGKYFPTLGLAYEQSFYGISQNLTYATHFDGWGTVRGTGICSSTPETNFGTIGTPSNESGQYCWCNITDFRETGESNWIPVKSAWIFRSNDNGGEQLCLKNCVNGCADAVGLFADYRATLLNSINTLPDTCSPNTINIKWYNEGSVHDENTCTYAESVTLPETNPERTGYNFTGWTVRPASTPAATE